MRYNRHMMDLLKGSIVIASLLVSTGIAMAQNITNVDANQEGKAIAITYSLDEKANISLFATQDGGATKIAIPLEFMSGDVGKRVRPGKEKKILWRPLEQMSDRDFRRDNLSFIVVGTPSIRFFATLNGGYSMDSGLMLGATVGQLGRFGWYVKGMTSLSFPKGAAFESERNGYVDGVMPAYSGLANKFKAYGIVGANVRLGIPVYLNAGIGYGRRVCEWQTSNGNWVKVKETDTNGALAPQSYANLAVDFGVMTKIQNFVVSLGATWIYLGRDFDFSLGLGYLF